MRPMQPWWSSQEGMIQLIVMAVAAEVHTDQFVLDSTEPVREVATMADEIEVRVTLMDEYM